MSRATVLSSPSFVQAAAAAGWMIANGQAMTVRPKAAGTIRIIQGRAWITGDGPHPQQPERCGDLVLDSGASLPLHPGQRVVIESWARPGDVAPLQLAWVPVRQPWAEAVRQPATDLVQALGQAAHALARLVQGLWGLALQPR